MRHSWSSVKSGNERSDKGEDAADPSLSVTARDEEFSTFTAAVSAREQDWDLDFLAAVTGFFELPCFCGLAKLSQIAWSFASTEECRGLYSPNSPSTQEPWCLRWGKLSLAESPRSLKAALSYAKAASSAVSKVPSQSRVLFLGSRISATHFPQCRCLTPL
ncbi:hypothetical protein SDJN02_13456 [Cucurbita argyrosperma subsp. argyrosperma]|nr:hypothetical protein SDJN02_13456 [Cucurbita argyrosperma subsp. argyrosperma]